MKRIFQVFCGLLTAVMVLSSCLNSSDSSTTYYDDTAIESFTLGTLNRYLHTTSKAGNDSVYRLTYTGSVYKMNIDQLNHRIFNTDSLPIGTDVSHVVCTVKTRNNGYVYVKSLTSDTLRYFNSGRDSIDFTQPRLFRVFSSDGSGSRDYLVSLNLRSQEAGRLLWTLMPAGTEIPEMQEDGWEFALTEGSNGIIASNNHWATTINETLDTDASLLPSTNSTFACWEISKGLSYALLVGDSDGQADGAVVWRKIIDPDKPTQWVFMNRDNTNRYYLPKGHHYWLLPFQNETVLAINEDGTFYQSRDYGITWKKPSELSAPVTTIVQAATADDGTIWLRDNDGEVWHGIMTQ